MGIVMDKRAISLRHIAVIFGARATQNGPLRPKEKKCKRLIKNAKKPA